MGLKTKTLMQSALCAALLCILAPVSLPLAPVPVSLGTLAIYLVALSVPLRQSCTAVLLYLCLGALGLPVFASYAAGIGVLLGPTGGYLLSFVCMALLIGSMTRKERGFFSMIGILVLATCVCYLFGTLWFVMQTKSTFAYALSVCVVPFLTVDGCKIFLAALVGVKTQKITARWKHQGL